MSTFAIVAIWALAVIAYLFVGLRTFGTYYWCFGTSHNGYKSLKNKLYDLGLTILLIFFWPFFYAGFFIMVILPALMPRKRVDKLYQWVGSKEDQYRCLGKAKGAGTCHGEERVVYQDIKTKQLYFRTEDDFHNRMKLM